MYRDRILNLTTDFPENKSTEDGKPFWVAPKRFPLVTHFDPNNENHLNFIISYANILSVCYGISPEVSDNPSTQIARDHKWRDHSYINSIVKGFPVPEWRYKKSGETGDNKVVEKKGTEDDAAALREIIEKLRDVNLSGVVARPGNF